MQEIILMNGTAYMADLAALRWYVDHGVSDVLQDSPQDRTVPLENIVPVFSDMPMQKAPQAAILGKSDAYDEAVKLAASAADVRALAQAVYDFDGIGIKKTASNMVFASGNEHAQIMVIGDVPGADEDRQGTPFAGDAGRLLDKILACIGLDRMAEDPHKAVYLSTVINWRPPGNRSPNDAEIQVSLPFIERHIQLIAPKILIVCGAVAANALLGRSESMAKLRGKWHEYSVQTKGLTQNSVKSVPMIVTYPPFSLLNTPVQKRAVWSDMLDIEEKIKNLPQ